jgi:hypothetical protein
MNKVLPIAAILEYATGLALIFAPTLVGEALIGEQVAGVALVISRVTGIALIGLAVSCWPGPPVLGMLVYGVGVAIYLALIGWLGVAGWALWPAVGLHVLLSIALGRIWLTTRNSRSSALADR